MYIGKNKPDLYSVYPIDTLCDLRSDVYMFALLGLNILIIYFTFLQIHCSDWSRRNWKTPLTTTITAWNSKFIYRSQLQMTGHVKVSALQASFACKSVVYETDHNCFSLCLNCIQNPFTLSLADACFHAHFSFWWRRVGIWVGDMRARLTLVWVIKEY